MRLQTKNDLVINAVNTVGSRALADEINYYIEIDDDEHRPRNYYDALNQTEERAEYNADRSLLIPARKALIILNVYQPMTKQELRNTETSHGKNYAFKMNKKKYTFRRHL